MKYSIRFKNSILISLICVILLTQVVYAQDSTSSNYMLIGASFSSGSDETSTVNQRIYASVGSGLKDRKVNSSLYSLNINDPVVWTANIPKINCFETVTNGSTSCSSPLVNPDGMVMICGDGGCYDRARFEIDPQGNTSEVLYSIRISTDPLWGTWKYIDGSTYMIEDAGTHDIADYKTQNDWEQTVTGFNVLGLQPNTTYFIKVTALKGDFTESVPSVENVQATTSVPELVFDIDIDDSGGFLTENNGPYGVSLGMLVPTVVQTASQNIWIDLGTNARSGMQLSVSSQYGGMNSLGAMNTIVSLTSDLNTATEGYGMLIDSLASGYLGPILKNIPYDGVGNSIGGVGIIPSSLIYSSNPVSDGRGSVVVKAKSDTSTPAGSDYSDTLTFTLSGSF